VNPKNILAYDGDKIIDSTIRYEIVDASNILIDSNAQSFSSE
jgi:hypothetical protein